MTVLGVSKYVEPVIDAQAFPGKIFLKWKNYLLTLAPTLLT